MSGKITVILLISVTIIFGIIFFYFQNFAYYSRVSNKEIIVVNNIQIKVKEYLDKFRCIKIKTKRMF